MGRALIIRGADFSAVAVDLVTPIIGGISVSLSTNNEGYGTVTGAGRYNDGQSVTISAIANFGYEFVQWSDGNTEPTRIIVLDGDDVELAAMFSPKGQTELQTSEIYNQAQLELGGASMVKLESKVYKVYEYLIPANTSGVRIVHIGETGGNFRGAWSILDANGNVLHFRNNTTTNKPLEIDDTIQITSLASKVWVNVKSNAANLSVHVYAI
jgi:hypothetical protein